MVEILKGKIPEREGLREVLEIVTTSKDVNIGVLYVSGDGISGRIGVAWGRYVTGAMLDSGEVGRIALRKLLLLRAGSFRFVDTQGEPDMELRQSLGVDLNGLVPYVPDEIRPTVTPFLFEPAEIEAFQRLQNPSQIPDSSAAPPKSSASARTSMAELASVISDITEDNTQLLNSVDLQSGLTLGEELRSAYEKAVNTYPSGLQNIPLPNAEAQGSAVQNVQPLIDINQPTSGNHVVDKAANVVQRIDDELGTNATGGIVRPSLESLEPTIEIIKPQIFERPGAADSDPANEETQPLTQAQVSAAIENSRVTAARPPDENVVPEQPAPMSSLKKPFTRLIGAARNRSRLNAEARLANSALSEEVDSSESVLLEPTAGTTNAIEFSEASPSVSAPHVVIEDSAATGRSSESEHLGESAVDPSSAADPEQFTAVESKADILRQARKEAATFLAQETRAATHLRLKPVSRVAAENAAKEAVGEDAPVHARATNDFHTSFDFAPSLESDNTPSKPAPFNVQLPPPPVPSWLGSTETASTDESAPEAKTSAPRASQHASPMDLQEMLERDTLQTLRAIEIMQEQGTAHLQPLSPEDGDEQVCQAEPDSNEPTSPSMPPAPNSPAAVQQPTDPVSRLFDVSDAVAEAMRSFKDPVLPSLSVEHSGQAQSKAPDIEWDTPVPNFDKKDSIETDQTSDDGWSEPLLQSKEPHINMADMREKRPVPPVPSHPFLSTINNRRGEPPESELSSQPPIAPRFELPELIAVPGGSQMEPPGSIPPAPFSGDRAALRLSEKLVEAPPEFSLLRTIMFCLVLFVLSCVATVLLAPGLLQWVTSLLHH